MKKVALAAALIAVPHLASADTILGLYAGAGIWNTSMDGTVGSDEDPITSKELGIDSNQNTFFYAALEHPIPLVPNIRIAHTGLQVDGQAIVSREFTLDEYTFQADADTATEIDLTHTDFTLYYELLDNWVTMDLGITARQLDGYAKVEGTVIQDDEEEQRTETVDLDVIVPMLYARAQFDLPLTGFHAGGAINYIGYEENTFSDIDVYVGYSAGTLGLDMGIDVGYRKLNVTVDDDEDLTADVSVDGIYAALTLHF